MNIGSIFIILAILLLTALYIAHPLLQKTSSKVGQDTNVHSSLLAERERLLSTIEELDYDHELGKIAKEEYTRQRQILLIEGAAVLKKLEQSDQESASTPEKTNDSLDALIVARRQELREKKKGDFCPKCGHKIKKSDKFCASCGSDL